MSSHYHDRVVQARGLKALHDGQTARRVAPGHVWKLTDILAALDRSRGPDDMNLPGFRLHSLKGEMKGHHAVSVSGSWRVTFRFEDGSAVDVDYVDYHRGGLVRGDAESSASGRHRETLVSRAPWLVRGEGCRRSGSHAPSPLRSRERERRNFNRNGDSSVQGVRVEPGDLARHADGLRSVAGPEPHQSDHSREIRGGWRLSST